MRLDFSCSISQEIRKPLICLELFHHLASLWQKGIKQIVSSHHLSISFAAKRSTLSTVAVFPRDLAPSPPSLAQPPPPLPPWSSHQPLLSSPERNQKWRQPSLSGIILYSTLLYTCRKQFEFTTRPIYLELEHFIAWPKYLDVSYNSKCFETEVWRSPRIMSFINSLWVHILMEI